MNSMIKTSVTQSDESKEGAMRLLRENGLAIMAQAAKDCNRTISPETHILALVSYHTGAWEVGIIPKMVEYDGMTITSHGIYLYRHDIGRVRGPNSCSIRNGEWWYWPD